jgi:hypothetical protein
MTRPRASSPSDPIVELIHEDERRMRSVSTTRVEITASASI